MGKLRVFFTIALVVLLLPLSAFGRHKKGDIVQDPNHSNITRECVSDEVEESDRWLVHITGTLPVSGMHNGHPYVDLGLNYKIPCSGVISRPAASTSCRSFFITSAGIHLRSTLTVRTRLRLRTMSIGA